MNAAEMRYFADDWAANWGKLDVAAIIAHFADDCLFVSPLAAEITGAAEVRGRTALERYWRQAAAPITSLRFDIRYVTCDEARREMVVVYTAHRNGTARMAAEVMRFDDDGRQVYGEALYGAML